MHRSAVMFLVISLSRAGIVPIPKNTRNLQNEEEGKSDQTSFTSQAGNQHQQLQTYSSAQGNQLVTSQYFYPAYPDNNSNGYAIQSRYEGYLHPTAFSSERDSHSLTKTATNLLPFSNQLLLHGARAGAYIVHLLSAILIGGAFMTIFCTFTPICTISFINFGFAKDKIKEQVTELARTYVTPETVDAATVLISKAIDNYTAMQFDKYDNIRETSSNQAAKISGTSS